jgi:Ti-type conjugative transfer relaxase TraA
MAHDLEAARLTSRDVIVIDEAAMVGSRQMQRLLSAASQAGAKVILVGDHEQLQAVDAGAAFRALREAHGAQEITEVRRQAGEERQWMRDATQEFGRAETAPALARYRDAGMTHQAVTRDVAKADLVSGWTAARRENEQHTQIILAYTRADVAELNRLARAAYREEGRLGDDTVLKTGQGDKPFAAGDRLYFTRNDTRLGVKNGTLGTIAAIDGNQLKVTLDNGRSVGFDVQNYGHIAHGYAATVHKSQGVTVDRAHILASRYMDRHAAYVGMTRHRDRADLYFGTDEFKDFETLSRRLSRNGAKTTTLDFLRRNEELAAELRKTTGRAGADEPASPSGRSPSGTDPTGQRADRQRPAATLQDILGLAPGERPGDVPAKDPDAEKRVELAKRLLKQFTRTFGKTKGLENSRD